MVRIQGATFGDVTDRATRLLGIAQARGYAYDGSSWLEQRADGYNRLGMIDIPWWVRKYGGRPIFMDDMEGTLKWTQALGTITKDSTATFVHSGTSALKGVTAAIAASVAAATMFLAKPSTSATKFQAAGVHFCLQAAADTTPRSFELDIRISDGTTLYYAQVRYLHYLTSSQKKLQYYDSSQAWTDMAGGSMPIWVTQPQWHDMVLMTKRGMTDWRYYRLFVDGKMFDLDTIALYSIASSDPPSYFVQLSATTDAALATTFYADDFWLVEDMPSGY